MLEQIETTVSTLPTRPDPLHKHTTVSTTTDSPSTPNHVTTKNLNSKLTPGNKRKLDVSKPTTQNNVATNTQPNASQHTTRDNFTKLLWYNSSPISHNFIFGPNKKANCTIPLSTRPKMQFEIPDIPNFIALDDDTYLEQASLLNRTCNTHVTKKHLAVTDYKLAEERDSRASIEPNAKRIKNESLPGSFYAKIARAINIPSVDQIMVVAMDMTLQNYRAQKAISKLQSDAASLRTVDLTDETDASVSETPPEHGNNGGDIGDALADTKPAAIDVHPDLPAWTNDLMSKFKAEIVTEMDTRTKVTPNDKATTKQEPAPAKKTSAARRLFIGTQVFKWQGIAHHNVNQCISTARAMNTFKTVFPNMKPEPPLLSCPPRDNPRASLETALAFVGAIVPTQWLDKVFQADHTKSDTTIATIFDRHNAAAQFAYKDYATAVIENGLTPGIANCFKGQNAGNFAGEGCFTTTTPLLCQMQIKGNQVQRMGPEYQWLVYIPHMNVVVSCNDYRPPNAYALKKQQHVWILGKNTIKALTENSKSSIDKLLGKLAFPAKNDNAKELEFVSAVWIQNINSNFNLVDDINEY